MISPTSTSDPRTLPVACVQLAVTEDPRANIDLAVDAVGRAAEAGARLVVLPEATLAPFGTDLARAAREHAPAFDDALTAAADDRGVVAAAGSFTAAADGRVHNTVIVRGPGVRADYDKIHLFDAFGTRESDTIASGRELCTVDVHGVRVGLATCYDLRFPEQFRALADLGAEVVALPAAWAGGAGKVEQWRLLVRARALDATVFLVACDQVPPAGSDDPARGVGASAVVSPLGEVMGELADEPGLLRRDLAVGDVQDVRRRLPVLQHRAALPPR